MEYLRWARRFYGKVPFDLASSGMATVSSTELGAPAASMDDPAGWESLRGAIARYNDVPRTEAIATLGTSHALWLAYATLLAPGDEVLVEAPAYEPLWRTAEGVGARVLRFERPAASRFALDPERVARAITPRTRVVAVTNLHNPGGVRASEEVLREVARIAASAGARLLVDEVYAPFDDLVDGAGVFRKSARRLGGNVVVASSLTKCFGLGPDRFGWMLGPEEVIARADDVIMATCGMLPLSHAHRGVHAFSRVEALAVRARTLLAGKRERVAEFMAARPDLEYSAPESGLFGFASARAPEDLTAAIERGAEAQGVLVAAGAFFGVPNGFRIAWSIESAKLEGALTRLGESLPAPRV